MQDRHHSLVAGSRSGGGTDKPVSRLETLNKEEFMSETVKAILDRKGREVVTLAPQASIGEAATTLNEHRIGAIVVTGVDGAIVGIFTERDLVRAVAQSGAGCLTQPVSSIMTSSVKRCSEDTRVNELMEVMTAGRFRHLPVEHGGKLGGIVSIGDVVKSRISEVEREAADIKAYIAS